MQRPLAPTILLTFAIAGCATSGSTPQPSPSTGSATVPTASSGTPAPASTPNATVALGPSMRVALDTSGPMVASDAGPKDHVWDLPATAARDRDGGFVLFIVWFGDAAGDQIVTVAHSDDGRHWQIGKDAILDDLGMDLVRPMAIPSAGLQLDDGTWRLYGWAAHRASSTSFTSWAASAPKPEGPWSLDAASALDKGASGSWDSQTAAIGAVRRDGDGFVTWYEGQGPGNSARGEIGYATSADGLAWQKAPDPVIRRGICGAGTSVAITQPQVEGWSGGLAALFAGTGDADQRGDVFGATSVDGRTWTCASTEPLLRADDIPGSQGIHTIASVPLDGNRFELIVESLAGNRSELWSAIVEVGP
ncbi:MAG TPA: hypothetical protein VJ850_04800 [Candidatus Limnocylindrales bacterium]|nr:hypothetical protein [Candidatus Limnocylindrales bacterium]